MTVSVSHPEAGLLGSPAIDAIIIRAPGDLLTLASGSSPGWTATRLNAGTFRFTGGRLDPGQSQGFSLSVDAAAASVDSCADWLVMVSSDGGATTADAAASSSGALTSCLRVLQTTGTEVVAPPAATDGTVTSGQQVCVHTRVKNTASAALTVAPSLSGLGFSTGAPRVASNPACGGAFLTDGTVTLAPGDGADLAFDVTYGAPGSATVRATATAEGASTSDPVTSAATANVEPAPVLSFVAGSLAPDAINPNGNAKVAFSLQVTQGVSGAPRLSFDEARSSLSFQSYGPVGLAEPLVVDPASTVQLVFDGMDVPDELQDGRYAVTAHLEGVDANDARLAIDLPASGVKLDRAVPIVLPTAIPPPSMVDAEPGAVKDGDELRFAGSIRDIDDNGNLTKCSSCLIERALLIQFSDPFCSQVGGAPDIDVTVLQSNGNLSGSYTGAYAPGTQCVQLVVYSRDEVGNRNSGKTNAVQVDNVALKLIRATALLDPQTGRRNIVGFSFNKPVVGWHCGADWLIEDEVGPNPVIPDPAAPSPLQQTRVVVARDFSDDPSGRATYRPLQAACGAYMDRVGHTADPYTLPMTDGIAPTAPEIRSVEGQPASGGTFRFSVPRPSVVIGNPADSGDHAVRSGYVVRLYEDSDGQPGLQMGSDRKLCGDLASGPTVTLSCEFSHEPRQATVFAVAIDTHGNVGTPTPATFVRE